MDGCLVEVNEAYCRMSGYSESELLAMRISDLKVEETAVAIAARMREIKVHGEGRFESRHRRKDGSFFDIEVSVRYQASEGGRFVSFLRDITEQRQIEQELAEEQHRSMERLQRSVSSIVEIVSQVAETRDPYTAGHQRRVSELAVRISEDMGTSAAQIEETRIAALLHDIGKMSVPAEILAKPGMLSPLEFELIKAHAEAGYRIIASAQMEGLVAEIVYEHHERCDGSGYPRGLGADELLPASKVLMVADVVEAMTSHRPYRPGLGIEAALAEIEQGAGGRYDAQVATSCLRVFRELGFAFSGE
jgi:PAS domain S-box-containing protein/putative nucleotidyltransferase with HDIG domain